MPPGLPGYCGRFAPSPTGPLHPGSLVSALASYLDARLAGGRWLVRIEDIDGPRTAPGATRQILEVLAACGMHADAPPLWQSQRMPLYDAALTRLRAAGLVYPCGCSRREIADSQLHAPVPARAMPHARAVAQVQVPPHAAALTQGAEFGSGSGSGLDRSYSLPDPHRPLQPLAAIYPGTCRAGLNGKPARAWRLRVPNDESAARITFIDRWAGPCSQDLATEVGDFVLRRADGQWAYQLAVVVDDAAMQVTDVVRGADLLDSTARQIYLQRCLGLPTPRYLHVPVVTDPHGRKLSKQTGAVPVDAAQPLPALHAAAAHLGLDVKAASVAAFHQAALAQWAERLAAR